MLCNTGFIYESLSNYFTNFPVLRCSGHVCEVQYDRWARGRTRTSISTAYIAMWRHPASDRTLGSITGTIVAVAYKVGSHRLGRTTLQTFTKDSEMPLWHCWDQWENNLESFAWFIRDANAWCRIPIFKYFGDFCAIIRYRGHALPFWHPSQFTSLPYNNNKNISKLVFQSYFNQWWILIYLSLE